MSPLKDRQGMASPVSPDTVIPLLLYGCEYWAQDKMVAMLSDDILLNKNYRILIKILLKSVPFGLFGSGNGLVLKSH